MVDILTMVREMRFNQIGKSYIKDNVSICVIPRNTVEHFSLSPNRDVVKVNLGLVKENVFCKIKTRRDGEWQKDLLVT